VAQDYYDILQPFDYIVNLLDDHKATLGLRYIAQNDEQLIPEYPAVLVQADNTIRELHATRQYYVRWDIDLWVFHAELTLSQAVRSRKDIELATDIRKLLHSKSTMDGHIIFGYVVNELPGVAANVTTNTGLVTTRVTWRGENRVRFEDA
jgi:hypothetical protein